MFNVKIICNKNIYITGNTEDLGYWNTLQPINGFIEIKTSGPLEYRYKTLYEWEPIGTRFAFIDSDCVIMDFYGERESIHEKVKKCFVQIICDKPDLYILGNIPELGSWKTPQKINEVIAVEVSGFLEYKYICGFREEQRTKRKIFIDSNCIITDEFDSYKTKIEKFDAPVEEPKKHFYADNNFLVPLSPYNSEITVRFQQDDYPKNLINEDYKKKVKRNIPVSGYVKKDGTKVGAYFKNKTKNTKFTPVSGYVKKHGTKVKAYKRQK